MLRALTVLAGVVLVPLSADAAVRTKKVPYKHGAVECQGYLAWDDAVNGRRPGILIVHEWWGLNDYARQRAEQLAKLGYVATLLVPNQEICDEGKGGLRCSIE
jgi:Dienelactone hydrolase family